MTQVLSTPMSMDGPFGYAFFNDGRDEPAPPPEPPTHGKPLLSDTDQNLNNRLFSSLADPQLLESLAQYHAEPVPSLYGSSSHFGHPEMDLSRTLGLLQQQTAAGYNVGPMSAPAHTPVFPLEQHPQLNYPTVHPMPMHHRTQSNQFIKPETSMQPKPSMNMRAAFNRRASTDYVTAPMTLGDNVYTHTAREMLKEGRDARPDSYLERRMTFTYGTDTGFRGSGYTPPETLRNAQRVTEASKIDIVHSGYKAPMRRGAGMQPGQNGGMDEPPMSARSSALESIADELEPGDGNLLGHKRGRGDVDSDDADSTGNATPRLSRKKTKPSLRTDIGGAGQELRSPSGNNRTPASASGLVRKPSDSGAAKPTRVNLTEEEKKQNHIRSEQKRRNQIKEGFADLTELMPDAASAGPSKCIVLAKAVEWLNDLIEGNNTLKSQLTNYKDPSMIEGAK